MSQMTSKSLGKMDRAMLAPARQVIACYLKRRPKIRLQLILRELFRLSGPADSGTRSSI